MRRKQRDLLRNTFMRWTFSQFSDKRRIATLTAIFQRWGLYALSMVRYLIYIYIYIYIRVISSLSYFSNPIYNRFDQHECSHPVSAFTQRVTPRVEENVRGDCVHCRHLRRRRSMHVIEDEEEEEEATATTTMTMSINMASSFRQYRFFFVSRHRRNPERSDRHLLGGG